MERDGFLDRRSPETMANAQVLRFRGNAPFRSPLSPPGGFLKDLFSRCWRVGRFGPKTGSAHCLDLLSADSCVSRRSVPEDGAETNVCSGTFFLKRNAGKPIRVYVTAPEQLLRTPTTRCRFNREDVFNIIRNGFNQKKTTS